MHRLGYTRYVAQGGDVGAAVTDAMGRQAPEGLLGIHMNLLVTVLAGPQPAESEQERAAADAARHIQGERLRLLPGDGHAAADDRLRPAGFTRRPGGLAARPRHGQLLQDLPRLRRRRARGQSHPGPHRRQHHAVLADGHRRLGGPVVLGGRTSPGSGARVRPGSSGGLAPGRLHHVPRRDLADPAQLGRERPTRTSPTSTRSTRAATSPPGRSRSSSRRRCGRRSGHCARPDAQRRQYDRTPIPEGPGSVSGAPNLPAGFADTFTSRYVDAGDVRLHAVIGGDGPPLLLVHGWPQTWYAWRMRDAGAGRGLRGHRGRPARHRAVRQARGRLRHRHPRRRPGRADGARSATSGSPCTAPTPACRSPTPWPRITPTGSSAWSSPRPRSRASLPHRRCSSPRRSTPGSGTSPSTSSPRR